MTPTPFLRRLLPLLSLLGLTLLLGGCGTMRAIGNLEDGAGAEAGKMWDRWVASDGDIAVATTWERKVAPGVTQDQIEQSLASVASEMNIRSVGDLPLSKELEARTGQPQKLLKVYNFCNPFTARKMVDFSPHMAAYLPCRITLVERDDGLWMYTLNMDMMIRMGRKLPDDLKQDALRVREAIWLMMERGSKGEF
jgi:uncharacterized protein (DUF302 family)